MTEKQWRVLELLDCHDMEGSIEVCLQFGEYEPLGPTEADEAKAWNLTCLVVGSIVRSLVKKGLATNQGAWGITDKGRALLEKHKKFWSKQ